MLSKDNVLCWVYLLVTLVFPFVSLMIFSVARPLYLYQVPRCMDDAASEVVVGHYCDCNRNISAINTQSAYTVFPVYL